MRTSKDSIINKLRQAMAGIGKHFPKTSTLVLGGTSTSPTAVVATFQAAIDAIDKAAAAEQAFHDATAAQHTAVATAEASLAALQKTVESQLGSAAGLLGDFGFETPKRQVPSEATKAAAVLKRKATREARGTGGKRQKAKVKGAVPETAAPTAPAPTTPTTTTTKPA